jgi:hypothetical protein
MKTLANPDHRSEILNRLAAIGPDTPRRWGTLTSPEMICHLADAFRIALGERESDELGSIFLRTIGKVVAIYLPFPWPHNVPTRPESDPKVEGTRPTEFAADVEALRDLCHRFGDRSGGWSLHPAFGALNDAAWHRWGYRHMDHHLRQFGA